MLRLLVSVLVALVSATGQTPDSLTVGSPGGDCKILDRGEFVNCVRGDWKIPQWTAEHYTRESLAGDAPRTNRFYPDPEMPPGQRAELVDYRDRSHGPYDRGHQAAASSHKKNKAGMRRTFNLGNMGPQTPELNRDAWRKLEDCTRALADSHGDVYVFTAPVFEKRVPVLMIGPNQVAVPEYYGKALLCRHSDHDEMFGFAMANEHRPLTQSPNDYSVMVRMLESLTGLNFFSALPQAEQDALETVDAKLPPEATKWRESPGAAR